MALTPERKQEVRRNLYRHKIGGLETELGALHVYRQTAASHGNAEAVTSFDARIEQTERQLKGLRERMEVMAR